MHRMIWCRSHLQFSGSRIKIVQPDLLDIAKGRSLRQGSDVLPDLNAEKFQLFEELAQHADLFEIRIHEACRENQRLEAADAILEALQAIVKVLVCRQGVDEGGDGFEFAARTKFGLNVAGLLVDFIKAGARSIHPVVSAGARKLWVRAFAFFELLHIGQP